MNRVLEVVLMTAYGPAPVYIDRRTAKELLPYLEELTDMPDPTPIDLVECTVCLAFAVVGHPCPGPQKKIVRKRR
jgi:hypothetical protein